MANKFPQHIAVLYGGSSAEREVSLRSGASVAEALKQSGYKVTLYDTQESSLVTRIIADKPDLAFPALHGNGGEDGSIQGFFETIGLRYVGSGILASAIAIDKAMSKHFYSQANIPTAPYFIYRKESHVDLEVFAENALCELGEKMVVKPASEGSSLGMSIVKQAEDTVPALEKALRYDSVVLVEKFIVGTEVTVAVLGNKEARALPVIEIIAEDDLYDYEAKYTQGGSTHIIPARLNEKVYEDCQKLALRAHSELGCEGISRTDIIVDSQGQPWVLETNTMPGMTELSLVPDAASHAGIDMPELVQMLVAFAVEK